MDNHLPSVGDAKHTRGLLPGGKGEGLVRNVDSRVPPRSTNFHLRCVSFPIRRQDHCHTHGIVGIIQLPILRDELGASRSLSSRGMEGGQMPEALARRYSPVRHTRVLRWEDHFIQAQQGFLNLQQKF